MENKIKQRKQGINEVKYRTKNKVELFDNAIEDKKYAAGGTN